MKISTLDRYLHDETLDVPVLMEFEVEDHEAAVLCKATQLIGRYRPLIICEILPRSQQNREMIEIIDKIIIISHTSP